VVLVLVIGCSSIAFAQRAIAASEAASHVGEYAKVCGEVASTHFAYRSRGAPTFINLDRPYPYQVFTALIWAEDRSKFGVPEERYANKQICVSGVIQSYRGVPETILRDPGQVQITKH
jgi:micrococcal nuclease